VRQSDTPDVVDELTHEALDYKPEYQAAI